MFCVDVCRLLTREEVVQLSKLRDDGISLLLISSLVSFAITERAAEKGQRAMRVLFVDGLLLIRLRALCNSCGPEVVGGVRKNVQRERRIPMS